MIKLPDGVVISNLIDDLRIFSWQAADILLYYSKLLEDSDGKRNILKNNNEDDPVTLADLKVNELIIKRINEKYINVNWDILSEENVKISSKVFDSRNDWIWVLDPLDGTKDFIQGTGNYAMHLALIYKKNSILGIVLIPERDELWISCGDKVWCQRRNNSKLKAKTSSNRSLNTMTIVSSKNHKNEILEKLIKKINFRKKITMGSIGCKIASILRGESDIYISLSLPGGSSPKDWDFAAPEAILNAAGGTITNLQNEKLRYGSLNYEQRGIIIASNSKKNHEKICLQINKIVKEGNIISS